MIRMNKTLVMMTLALVASVASAQQFQLLTGVDANRYPGTTRFVSAVPGPGLAPGQFSDGDRLAGTADVGGTINWLGSGSPLYTPNQFGSLSFLYRRGSLTLNAGGLKALPIMAIESLGGPQLDLDGNLGNGSRSLVPVAGQTPVAIPGSTSTIGLNINHGAGSIGLTGFDVTGTNEGSQGIAAGNGVTVNTLAGTTPLGGQTGAINPAVDTRSGTLTPFSGSGGTLTGVSRVSNLGYEFWQDAIEPTSSTASTLGTFQYLGGLRGWLIERDGSGNFPTLAGQGLGSTLWSAVSGVPGGIFNTTLPGAPTTSITGGTALDGFAAANNGGLTLTAFGGDLGAYLDAVVVPLINPNSDSFVFLESAGFGIANSPDPVFADTVGYDVVLIAQSTPVPEPATLALLVCGAALIGRSASRRSRHENA